MAMLNKGNHKFKREIW